jgi:cell division protein ZapE
MTPLEDYQEQCKKGLIAENPEQLRAVMELQRIYLALLQARKSRKSIIGRLRQPKNPQGLYLWGGVGIGKTFLMDLFYRNIPFPEKIRMHFHAFMQWVHLELKRHQGEKDPLKQIARRVAKKTQLLCFDELFVTDIADAMLLGRLLNALFEHGVCLVVTSNMQPDDLYKNGLQRRLFLPTIALLKQHTQVMHIPIQTDYRLQHLKSAGYFFIPNDEDADENMEKCFELLANGTEVQHQPLKIADRQIPIKKEAGDMVWFDYKVLCMPPRSPHDYLAIAKKYSTVFISDVPVIPHDANDRIALFIRMIDVFYDARVRLILTAEAGIEQLYTEGRMLFEYQRTCSRLMEMQSEGYAYGGRKT